MSGLSSPGGSPQRPNELITILHYVLAYDVRIGSNGTPVQLRPSDSPLPREVVVAAMHRLRQMAPAVMDSLHPEPPRPQHVDHHPV